MEATKRTEATETPDYSPRIAAAGEAAAEDQIIRPANDFPAAAPDLAALWDEILRALDGEAAGALRVGRNLIKIKAALPHGRWAAALREHGMSQPQAWRYMEYAKLYERDPAAFARDGALYQRKGFSLSEAIGERREKEDAAAATGAEANQAQADEAPIPESELDARLAEVSWWLKQAVATVEAGEAARATEPPPDYAGDAELWRDELGELVADVIALVEGGLEARLSKRLLPGPGA